MVYLQLHYLKINVNSSMNTYKRRSRTFLVARYVQNLIKMLIMAHNNTLNNLIINDEKKKNNIRHLFCLTLESYDRVNLHTSYRYFEFV